MSENRILFCKSDKISRIIVSSKPEASHIYDGKIEISDTKKLEEETYDEISRVMLSIHDIDPSLFSGDATLLVTQPFAESGYCTKKEQKALMEKLCAPYKGTQLFVKPHDKDRINYEYLGGMVLPRKTPTAVFNYLDEKISRVISFESGAIEALDVAKEKISVIDTSTSEPADVKKAIQDYIKTDAGKSQESMSAKKRIKRKMKKMLNS